MQTAILSLLALILAGGIYWIATATPGPISDESIETREIMEKEAAMMDSPSTGNDAMTDTGAMMGKDAMQDDAMMKKDTDSMLKTDAPGAMMDKKESTGATSARKGSIEPYSPEKIAFAETGKVVLFFHASWCPICRGLDAEEAANPNIVPDGVTVLKVDYDTATALRQKYGVTVQHTFVQVDAAGNLISKWSDTSKYAQVFARLQ